MTRWSRLGILLLLASTSCAANGQAEERPSLFDSAKHMRVAEVKPGMKGYGLSVFEGTRIDRFDVEVMSVLKNFNPKYDVVLIRCHGANLEHTGAIAGMSGSPIYLTDDQGKQRLIGAAFAYGWSLMKDPIAGVQPIEYMLDVGASLKPEAAATQPAGGLQTPPARGFYRYDTANPPLKLAARSVSRVSDARTPLTGNDAAQLMPLATPLMVSGLSPRLIEQYAPMLKQYGLLPMQTGGTSGATTQPVQLAPGSVMAAPLLTGDVSLNAIGTCTEVLGERVFGFGHPFNNEGPIAPLPMASGYINAVIPTLSQSFKIGGISEIRGTLIADQAVGVAGRLGAAPPTIPIDIHVIYTDGSLDETYHFNAAAHPRLTPVLAGVAVSSALSGKRDLPQYHTANYDLALKFANNRSVELKNAVVNAAGQALFQQIANPLLFAAENPYERVMLTGITGTVRIAPEAREADMLSVTLPKMKYRPGETLRAFLRYRPFRASEAVLPIELELSHDLPDGKYQLTVCDQETYLMLEQMAHRFRFTAESIDDVFAVLKELSSLRADSVYVELQRHADGVAVGRTAMPLLPSSRRQVLLDAGRSDVTPFVSTVLKVIPTNVVMNGVADFEIEIDSENRVEGGTHPAKPEPHQGATPLQPPTVHPRPAPSRNDPPEIP